MIEEMAKSELNEVDKKRFDVLHKMNESGELYIITEGDDEIEKTRVKNLIVDFSKDIIFKKWLKSASIDNIAKESFWKKEEEKYEGLYYLGQILLHRKNIRIHSDKMLTNLSSIILESVINKVAINKIVPTQPTAIDFSNTSGIDIKREFTNEYSVEYLNFLVNISEKSASDLIKDKDFSDTLVKFCKKYKPKIEPNVKKDNHPVFAENFDLDYSKMRAI